MFCVEEKGAKASLVDSLLTFSLREKGFGDPDFMAVAPCCAGVFQCQDV